jgi:hypothetical protein
VLGDIDRFTHRLNAGQRRVRKSLILLRGRASLLSKPTVSSVGKDALSYP